MNSQPVLLLWVAGGFAAFVFVFFDWSGYHGTLAPLTTRYLSDIWWHFPVMWLAFWVAFVGADAVGRRRS